MEEAVLKIGDRLRGAAVLFLLCGVAPAATLLNITDTLSIADPTQSGRLARNNVAQDWVDSELFPGVINLGTSYFYQTYSVNVDVNSFIQISFDDVSSVEFASAYIGAYLHNSAGSPNFGFDTNWLGDAGNSGDFFGTDPRFFQVVVPAGSNLVVVVNNTTGGPTLPPENGTYNLLVEGFIDQNYDDAPEPSSAIPMTTALSTLGLALLRRRRPLTTPPASLC